MTHPLLDLAQFHKDHPPRDLGEGQWHERETHELFLRPCVRIRLAVDQTHDIAHGLWRDDELAEAGICSAETDSMAFAEHLNASLGQHLSIRNLQDLMQVLGRELADAEARREEARRRAG